MTSNPLQLFEEAHQVSQNTVRVFDNWVVSVRLQQVTLGAMLVSARRDVVSFDEMTAEEMAELSSVFAYCERFAKSLGAKRINILALMMKDPLVHFHVIPRYENAVVFANTTWTDDTWPGPPQLGAAPSADAPAELLQKMREF